MSLYWQHFFCCSRGERLVLQKSVDPRDFGESGEDGDVTDFEHVPAKQVSEAKRVAIKQIKTFNNFR